MDFGLAFSRLIRKNLPDTTEDKMFILTMEK
jgi:hypothetical protein